MSKEKGVPDINKLFGQFGQMLQQTSGDIKNPAPWWQTYSYPEVPKFQPQDFLNLTRSALFFQSLIYGTKTFDISFHFDLSIHNEKIREEITNGLVRLGAGQVIYEQFNSDKHNFIFIKCGHGAVTVMYPSQIEIVTTDENFIPKVKEFLDGFKG